MSPFALRYKIPVLIALVTGLAVIVFGGETFWLNAIFAFAGALLGAVLIDVEYLIDSYLIDSQSPQAFKVKEMVSSKNLKGLVAFYNENEYQFGELSIRSGLFQLVLSLFVLYVIVAGQWIFMVALSLSLFANLLYVQIIEFNRTKTLQRWFWFYNGALSENFYKSYVVGYLFILIWLFTFL